MTAVSSFTEDGVAYKYVYSDSVLFELEYVSNFYIVVSAIYDTFLPD